MPIWGGADSLAACSSIFVLGLNVPSRSPWRVPSRANASRTGLGSAILIAQGMFKTQRVFVSLILFGIMGADLFYLVELVEAATTSALTGKSRRPVFLRW
jgi:hypothetical protein